VSGLLALLLLLPLAWGQTEVERTVSAPVAAETAEAAKPHLLHQAVADLLREKAADLGVDPSTIEAKLAEGFGPYFAAYKDRLLAERFGREALPSLPQAQRSSFLANLEAQRPEVFVRFARFADLLDAHAFKLVDRAPDATWKATLSLTLNPEKVTRYHRRLQAPLDQRFERLFLVTEVNAIGFSWDSLGVKDESRFRTPLAEAWRKWLQANGPENVGGVEECGDDCGQDFARWLQRAAGDRTVVSEAVLNGLWLRITFNLRRRAHQADVNEWQFEWSGSAVLQDADTKSLLASITLPPETRIWRGLDQKALNSAVASAMYRSALEPLTRIVRRITEAHRPDRVVRLLVQGHRQLGDLLSLIDSLKKEGKELDLELRLDTFGQREARLAGSYRGAEKSFTDLLSRLKAIKSSHNYRLESDLTGPHPVIKLVAE
jgi:hypothetical protein